MIVAFHPELNLERIIIYRSFAHSLDQLTTLNYLTREQITYIEPHLINMLRDVAFEVTKRKCKNILGQMFSIECALVKKTLLKWFNMKFKRQFEKLNPFKKMRFESQNPINWKENKCVICKFPLKLEPTNYLTPDNEMTFGDFIIRFKHKFLRNIYTIEQIESSDQINNLKNFYEIFNTYIEICIGLLVLLNQNRNDFLNDSTKEFVQETFLGDEICDIKNTINQADIKNPLEKSGSINKFNLKVYAYVYDQLVAFPKSEINYESITSSKFFIHVHELIKRKVHLHHSHITGQIVGYLHDFCNTKVIEKSNSEIPLVAYNLFGFDLFFFMKTYVASACVQKK